MNNNSTYIRTTGIMKRVLLTGATGFVGRHVQAALKAKGCSVRAIVRPGKILTGEIEQVETPDVFQESAEWWATTLRGIDSVVHCAWYAEPGTYLESEKNYSCLTGTISMAQALQKSNVKRFVGVGTCFEYDLSRKVLSRETPLKPESPYAACKVAAFLVLSQIMKKSHISFAWARLFYMFGEGEDERRLIAYIRRQLARSEPAHLSEGWQIRDYMDVKEVGRRIGELAVNAEVQGPVNICSGRPQTIREIALRIGREYGKEELLRFGARTSNQDEPDCIVGVPTQ